MFFATHNEIRMGGEQAQRMQANATRMGQLTGVADIIVMLDRLLPVPVPVTLCLELKRWDGSLSGDQERFRDAVLGMGFAWALIRHPRDLAPAIRSAGLECRAL